MALALASITGMKQGALVLLALFIAAVLIMLPREIRFLAGVDSRRRWQFLVLDILLVATVLAILIPSTIVEQFSLTGLSIMMGLFILLWVVAIWMGIARQRYVKQLLADYQRENEELLRQAVAKIKEEQEDSDD